MAGFRAKFKIVTLTAVLLLWSGPVQAVWGDYNDPMPVLFGIELGADLFDNPVLRKQHSNSALQTPQLDPEVLNYDGISVHAVSYEALMNKAENACIVQSISFQIRSSDFTKICEIMRNRFGNERDSGPDYYTWGKYEVEVVAWQHSRIGACVEFRYLPLFYTERNSLGHNFQYQGMCLGGAVKNYPLELEWWSEDKGHEEINWPDVIFYKNRKPPLVFDFDDHPPLELTETWVAYDDVLLRLKLRADEDEQYFLAWALEDLFDLHLPEYNLRESQETWVDDHTIVFPKPGMAVLTHMPTYWRMLRAKTSLEREYLNVKP